MEHSLQVGPRLIDRLVKRKFRGGFVLSLDAPVRPYTNDVLPLQGPFVNGTGCDPDIAFAVFNGDVSSRGGGRSCILDPQDNFGYLVTGML
jgi:hypothetical protein